MHSGVGNVSISMRLRTLPDHRCLCHWQELQKIYEPLAMADLSSELESILKGLVAKVNSRNLNY